MHAANDPQRANGFAPDARLGAWPEGRSFALFLSHDVDQIHDREMWRVLADLNHVRRIAVAREAGSAQLALRRIRRALWSPKPAVRDFATILEIEARHSFPSTFFLLHDKYWARNGARYRFSDRAIHEIVHVIRGAGCEIGLHGGYYRFNDAEAYRESRLALAEAFGVEPVGIRNHLLRVSEPDTWIAQARAGFSYDSTFGRGGRFGAPDNRCQPFWAVERAGEAGQGLLELPLTVMDVAVFRHCTLTGEAALDAVWAAITPVIDRGGLVTLLWHNNYFNEPEYWDWQWVYETLLGRLRALRPWCAIGADIGRWWRAREAVTLSVKPSAAGNEATITAAEAVAGLVLEVAQAEGGSFLPSSGIVKVEAKRIGWRIFLPSLAAGQVLRLRWDSGPATVEGSK